MLIQQEQSFMLTVNIVCKLMWYFHLFYIQTSSAFIRLVTSSVMSSRGTLDARMGQSQVYEGQFWSDVRNHSLSNLSFFICKMIGYSSRVPSVIDLIQTNQFYCAGTIVDPGSARVDCAQQSTGRILFNKKYCYRWSRHNYF